MQLHMLTCAKPPARSRLELSGQSLPVRPAGNSAVKASVPRVHGVRTILPSVRTILRPPGSLDLPEETRELREQRDSGSDRRPPGA